MGDIDRRPRVIISPHMDDAMLSLGGYILRWRDLGIPVHIINFFTISTHASGSQKDVEYVTAQRNREEKAVMEATGCIMHDCRMLDSPDRGYPKNVDIDFRGGNIDYVLAGRVSDEPDTVSAFKKNLTETLKEIGGYGKVIGPRAIGCHRDHLMGFRGLCDLVKEGEIKEAGFYEDMPYAAIGVLRIMNLTDMRLKPLLLDIDWKRKEDVLRLYESQVQAAWLDVMREYHNKLDGDKGFYERIFLLDPSGKQ